MNGIITFFDELNYGATLQAYALQTVLYKNNYESEFVNLSLSSIIKNKDFKTHFKDKIKMLLLYKSIRKKQENFKIFQKAELNISKYRCDNYSQFKNNFANKYNSLVFGSDQIWNPKLTGGKLEPFYFGDDINSTRKVAYAASCGNNKVLIDNKDEFIKYLSNFKGISVREEMTARIINEELRNNCEHVLDPTLLLEKEDWDRLIEKSSVNKKYLNSKYIFVYALEENESLNKAVETLSEKYNLKVITLRNVKHYINEMARFPHANPYDFLALIKNAQIVITNSYHAMLFSFIFDKSVVLFPHSLYNERIDDFLKLLNIVPNNFYFLKNTVSIKNNRDFNLQKSKSINYLIQNIGDEK